jgi:hypothetical protein
VSDRWIVGRGRLRLQLPVIILGSERAQLIRAMLI